MVRLLDKQREMTLLEPAFDLLWENMRQITPWELSYQEEKTAWLACVAPALGKAPRQMALYFDGEKLRGFAQYYCNRGVFMIEELQISRGYRSGSAAVALWKFLKDQLPADIRYVEAYADVRSTASQKLMEKLGMALVESNGRFLHYRAELARLPIFAELPNSVPPPA